MPWADLWYFHVLLCLQTCSHPKKKLQKTYTAIQSCHWSIKQLILASMLIFKAKYQAKADSEARTFYITCKSGNFRGISRLSPWSGTHFQGCLRALKHSSKAVFWSHNTSKAVFEVQGSLRGSMLSLSSETLARKPLRATVLLRLL